QMPGALFKESDLVQQEKLAGIDFQSRGRHPDELDIRSPIIPLSPGVPESDLAGKRDAKTLQAAYYAMIKLVDDQLGRILDCLKKTGQLDNTIVIFTSDHGETLGDHGLIQKGCRFYEGLVRVPLIISWPGRFQAGLRCSGLTELADIAPTLLEAAGLPVPSEMHGRSLMPYLKGEEDGGRIREFARCEYYSALDSSFCHAKDDTYATMIRDERYKLVLYHGHDLGELYDLEEDPDEFNNLWDEPAASETKIRLLIKSFDVSMQSMEWGPKRIGPM
ncbi:MAG: sulfatase-like hydrolase/transferase, partial [Planctomycetota bacterium]|nr:sulfatase-like hydrolase/transferase [Planctomycetota bacterium]